MESNQKILYENFKKESEENEKPVIREKCKKAAAEILKSFPHFEKKAEETKPETAKEKTARLKAEADSKEE